MKSWTLEIIRAGAKFFPPGYFELVTGAGDVRDGRVWFSDDQYAALLAKLPEKVEPRGPGTELAKLFSSLGIRDGANCSCRRHAETMDAMGPVWCRENINTILGWLRVECENRKLPFVDFATRIVVNLAIDRSEKV